MSKHSEPEMSDVVNDIITKLSCAQNKFENQLPQDDMNRCGPDEASKFSCGGQNCQARETPKESCPAAATQSKRNIPNNGCFSIQNCG